MASEILAGHPTAWRSFGAEGGKPMLALHCALAHGGAWAPLAALLPEWQFTAPDFPGHGGSAAPGDQDFHALCTATARSLAERLAAQAGPVDLIGHSLGGTVALRLALEAPELIRSLTLVEPVLFAAAKESPAWAANHAEQSEVARLIREQPEQAAALFQGIWGAGIPFQALPERQRSLIASQMYLIAVPGVVLMEDAAGMLAPGRLEGLSMPVLLAEGSKSPPVVAAIHDAFMARIPRAKRLVVAEARHMLPITHAAPLAEAMRAML